MTQTLAMMVSRKTVVLASFLLTTIMCFSVGYSGPICPKEAEYNLNSTSGLAFKNNVESLLSELSSKALNPNGFYNFTAVKPGAATAYGLFYCFAEAKPSECQTCVEAARSDILRDCANKTRGIIWGDQCFLRFSNESIFSRPDTDNGWYSWNIQNVPNTTLLNQVLGEAFDKIEYDAAYNDFSGRKYAVQVSKYITNTQKIYSLGQCSPDLSSQDCYNCLVLAVSNLPNCCDGRQGGNVLYPSCRIRYEMYPFIPPPTPSPAPSPQGDWPLSTAIIVVGTVVFFTIIVFFGILMRSRKTEVRDETIDVGVSNIPSEATYLRYKFSEIQAYTKNFAVENLIGQGGFGLVYKGTLPDGQIVAVKRLSRCSAQGGEEFISHEIALLANLQHENLVRVLGYCLEGEEKIIIYEFVFNKNLDYFLFDPSEKPLFNWLTRYKIIGGIARGLLHLRQNPRIKIIHRNLKASNVLLDNDMNPKISNFWMARLFKIDQSERVTSRIASTSGYMAPEYAFHGMLSEKYDVFSFGVLLLEIISGRKNTSNFDGDDLVSYAWKQWMNETPLAIIDPSMKNSYNQKEVVRCINIALLCVEEDVKQRFTMASVVLMLNSSSVTPPIPKKWTKKSGLFRTSKGKDKSEGLNEALLHH